MRTLFCALSFLAVTSLATAQCSLAVTGSGAPGTTVTATVTGSPGAFAFLALGDTQGSTTIDLGPVLGSFTLGLAAPFTPAPLGVIPVSGEASLAIFVPGGFPLSLDLFAQGVTLQFQLPSPPIGGGGPPTFGFTWCTTNVVAFHVGA